MQSSFLDFPVFPLDKPGTLPKALRGEGARKVLMVCSEASAADVAYAGKIVGAVKLSLEKDLFTLPLGDSPACSLSPLLRQLEVGQVLVFGVEPRKLGLYFRAPEYRPVTLAGRTYLFSCSLSALRAEREAGKREHAARLWEGLQEMFLADPAT